MRDPLQPCCTPTLETLEKLMARWPKDISLVKLAGTLPRNDTWSMGVYIHDPGLNIGGGTGPMAGVFGAIQDAAVNWFASSSSLISRSARLMSVKVNQIGENGKYLRSTTNELNPNGGKGVPGGVAAEGWQHMSLAITHRTSVARGPANAGRVFPPAVVISPGPTGVADDDPLIRYGNAWSGFLQAVYEAVPGELAGMPLVVSTGTKSAPNQPTKRQITRVEVGNVVDVQQRRRNALPETYVRATAQPAVFAQPVIEVFPGPELPV